MNTEYQMTTYCYDIITWLQREEILNDILIKEDNIFIKTINKICDNKNISTGINDAIQCCLKALDNIPYCKILMNESTFIYFSFNAENTIIVGTNNEQSSCDISINGQRYTIIKTNRNEIVKDNVIYFFVPQECFCQFSMQQDATLFLDRSGYEVTFSIYERPVCDIVNPQGVVKVIFS